MLPPPVSNVMRWRDAPAIDFLNALTPASDSSCRYVEFFGATLHDISSALIWSILNWNLPVAFGIPKRQAFILYFPSYQGFSSPFLLLFSSKAYTPVYARVLYTLIILRRWPTLIRSLSCRRGNPQFGLGKDEKQRKHALVMIHNRPR